MSRPKKNKQETESKILDLKRCKNCNSTMTYIRLKTRVQICRVCGHEEKLEEE